MTISGFVRPGQLLRDVHLPVPAALTPGRLGNRWRASRSTAPTWWRELLLLAGLYGAYEASRGFDRTDLSSALGHAQAILGWERSWHLSPELSLNHALGHLTPLAVVAAYFYSTLHYVITPAVLIWMYRRHAAHYRFARTALAISTGLGLIGFYLLPTAPPRLLAGSGLHDTLADVHRWGWWGGDGSVPRGLGGLSNQFAALPSLHVGWALWCGALIAHFAQRRWVRVLGVLYPLATSLVVLSTGNHYLVDVVAGAATMGVGAVLAGLLRRIRNAAARSQPVAPPVPARAPSAPRSLDRSARRPMTCSAARRPSRPMTGDASSPVPSADGQGIPTERG